MYGGGHRDHSIILVLEGQAKARAAYVKDAEPQRVWHENVAGHIRNKKFGVGGWALIALSVAVLAVIFSSAN